MTESTMWSNTYAPISDDTRSKAWKLTPDTYFKTHFWLGLYLLQNLSEEGLWKHSQPGLSAVPKKHLI